MRTFKIKRISLSGTLISLLATIFLFILLLTLGGCLFTGFLSPQVMYNLLIDNSFLIIIALGEAIVIIGGGIDLSVGALVALVSMVSAKMLQLNINPIMVICTVLLLGIIFGAFQGYLIQKFKIHPWIVTLAGMFLARGVSFLISTESIQIINTLFMKLSQIKIELFNTGFISLNVIISILAVISIMIFLKRSKLGRGIYALGGNEQSVILMGLDVGRIKISMYTISGFMSSLGGLAFTIYMLSGYGMHSMGLEMDAIAACVIGGILLTGGYGNIIGTVFGVLSMGAIQTIIMFQGTLNSWWTKIVVGVLLFIFIVLQVLIVSNKKISNNTN